MCEGRSILHSQISTCEAARKPSKLYERCSGKLRFRTCNLATRVRGVQKSQARNAAEMEDVSAKIILVLDLWAKEFCRKWRTSNLKANFLYSWDR